MNLNVELSFEDCLNQCLEMARAYIRTYKELEHRKISMDVIISTVTKSSNDYEALNSLEKLGLSYIAANTLLNMQLSHLGVNREEYYKNAVNKLEAIIDFPLSEKK